MTDHPLWIRTKDGLAFADTPERTGGRMPDFCVIGAAKAGTTSLNHYLDQHPDVFMCPLKEPHYFSADAIFEKGAQWCRGLYADAGPHQKCGEASTSYTRHPDGAAAPRRMAEANPAMRLVYIVREPVSRVQSDCLQTMKYARFVAHAPDMPDDVDGVLDYLSTAGRALATLPVENSEYMTQIDQYLKVFRREQLLVILSEDLKDKPEETLAAVYRHIGVDPAFRADQTAKLNPTDDFVESAQADRATSGLNRIPGAGALKKLLPQSLRKSMRSTLARSRPAQDFALSAKRKEALKAHFKPHNDRLAAFLDRDLSHWDA